MPPNAVIIDTNVFVAAGFNRNSASAHILDRVRSGRLRMVWNEQTRSETRRILCQIPPLSWSDVADLFQTKNCYRDDTCPDEFGEIPDSEDRKFAALAAATGAILLTNDAHLLNNSDPPTLNILTPRAYTNHQSQ